MSVERGQQHELDISLAVGIWNNPEDREKFGVSPVHMLEMRQALGHIDSHTLTSDLFPNLSTQKVSVENTAPPLQEWIGVYLSLDKKEKVNVTNLYRSLMDAWWRAHHPNEIFSAEQANMHLSDLQALSLQEIKNTPYRIRGTVTPANAALLFLLFHPEIPLALPQE